MSKCCEDYHAGMLDEPVTFERPDNSDDGGGGYTQVWGAIAGASNRAYVKALRGQERYASDRVEASARYRVVVRYFAGLLESDAITIRTRRHNIRFINNVELRDRWYEIDVDQGVAV